VRFASGRATIHSAVGVMVARRCTMAIELISVRNTSVGNLSTNFSAPCSGVGSAPARSVTQWRK
jgi:hypothetical protein